MKRLAPKARGNKEKKDKIDDPGISLWVWRTRCDFFRIINPGPAQLIIVLLLAVALSMGKLPVRAVQGSKGTSSSSQTLDSA